VRLAAALRPALASRDVPESIYDIHDDAALVAAIDSQLRAAEVQHRANPVIFWEVQVSRCVDHEVGAEALNVEIGADHGAAKCGVGANSRC
jgi:hypothetical protein